MTFLSYLMSSPLTGDSLYKIILMLCVSGVGLLVLVLLTIIKNRKNK